MIFFIDNSSKKNSNGKDISDIYFMILLDIDIPFKVTDESSREYLVLWWMWALALYIFR